MNGVKRKEENTRLIKEETGKTKGKDIYDKRRIDEKEETKLIKKKEIGKRRKRD